MEGRDRKCGAEKNKTDILNILNKNPNQKMGTVTLLCIFGSQKHIGEHRVSQLLTQSMQNTLRRKAHHDVS